MKNQVTPPPVTVAITDSYILKGNEEILVALVEAFDGKLLDAITNNLVRVQFEYVKFQQCFLELARQFDVHLEHPSVWNQFKEEKIALQTHTVTPNPYERFDFSSWVETTRLLYYLLVLFRETERKYLHARFYLLNNLETEG